MHDVAGHSACLASACIHRPDAHPVWSYYQISLVHLRPIEGAPPPKKHHSSSTHEICVLALDPRKAIDPGNRETLLPLTPPNLVAQMQATDEQARTLWEKFVRALASGELNPDTDHRGAQKQWFARNAILPPELDDGPIAYGARCTWWDSKTRVGSRRVAGVAGVALPCCPQCGNVLFECSREEWDEAVRAEADRAQDGDYPAFSAWMRGKCFPSIEAARAAYARSKPN